MSDWTDNEAEDLESLSAAVTEILRAGPEDLVQGLVRAATKLVCYSPAYVLAEVRRGLRDFRAELKKWKEPTP
jgi:hypothetical protein